MSHHVGESKEQNGGRWLLIHVLHVMNTGGVASVIAKYSDRTGLTKSTVITREALDPAKVTTFGKAYPDGRYRFALRTLLAATRVDLVHIHSWQNSIPWIKRLARRPVVLTFHGSDIQSTGWQADGGWVEADAVSVVNHYLLDEYVTPEHVRVILNAPDTDLFTPEGQEHKLPAVTLATGADEEAKELAKSMNLELDIKGRRAFSEMPGMLGSYEWYVDVRKSPITKGIIPAISKIAMEALACGTKVLKWDGGILETLPEENRPEIMVQAYQKLYIEVLG